MQAMKPFGMLALVLVAAALTACQVPQEDTSQVETPDIEEQVPQDTVGEDVESVEQEIDELDNLTEELDMSDLEGLEEDLEQI